MPGHRAGQARPVSDVASVLLPALLRDPLEDLAQRLTPDDATDGQKARQRAHLHALTGRVLQTGGWVGGERVAAAEPLLTGRTRPYDESTLRKSARAMSARGAVHQAESTLQRQVQRAVGSADVEAFTDLHDQVYWTKKLAWAAPVGNLGNRLLACTYVGLTFVRAEAGPCLLYHVSWHKPGSPLRDALGALHANERRHHWLTAHVALHVLDRGTQGDPTLRWMLGQGIPYLTLTNASVTWRRYRHPDHHTDTDVPIFVRRDERLRDADVATSGQAIEPRTIVFPAQPARGVEARRALRYRTAADLTDEAIEHLDQRYKRRWPDNENAIKELLAVGFGRNLDRTLDETTSRGHDGMTARLGERLEAHDAKLASLAKKTIGEAIRPYLAERKKRGATEAKLATHQASAEAKGSRTDRGGESLVKVLTALVRNALALVLWRSPREHVRTMTMGRVCSLLVRCSALAVMRAGRLTLWVETVGTEADQADQTEVVRLMNEARLTVNGSQLRLGIRDRRGESPSLGVVA